MLYIFKEVKMGEKRYIISDASKMLGVESHVLRYWEEELNVKIPRNEMGHRYYTDNHINLLKNVRDLKNQGIIKPVFMKAHDFRERHQELLLFYFRTTDPDERKNRRTNGGSRIELPLTATEVKSPTATGKSSIIVEDSNGSKMEQFQALMDKVVCKALKASASELGKEVSGNVSETVLKEMNYLMRTQDEREEERYKKLDEAMRSKQKMSRRERKKKLKAEKLLLKKSKEKTKKEKAGKDNLHIGKKVVTE